MNSATYEDAFNLLCGKLLDPDGVFDALDERFRKDYEPTPEALALVRQRIAEKIAMKPSWYRYEGKPNEQTM